MLGSPLAPSEGVIDVVTNVWENKTYMGKTGGIDVRHFEGFLDSSWEGTEY